ncbi:uncharacterized protein LOC117940986, partial [Etheostoma cragini]|uniref:uncharacterized protein LOC117940986 n=1 Tax=Etheostoma cragini TaxID=417921 RepID=UPI00155E7574
NLVLSLAVILSLSSGKRGKKPPVGPVNISEIVNRIAPKHGRPTVAEATLQRWIGDSAAIPCTPDVRVPKPKKKSPRPNGVDDLLKLAKQFDFNMFHQDEDPAAEDQNPELLSEDQNPELLSEDQNLELLSEDQSPELLSEDQSPELLSEDQNPELLSEDQSPELLSEDQNLELLSEDQSPELVSEDQNPELLAEDILDFQDDFSPPPPKDRPPSTKVAAIDIDPPLEDDLDFLFDAPTQPVSGYLSQMASTAPPSQGRPAAKGASGKPAAASSLPPSSAVSTTHAKGASATDEFEDDWGDDFLDDSLVFEMTQNPQNFTGPARCSTQKTLAVATNPSHRESPAAKVVQTAVSEVEKDGVRQRRTFRLESNPSFSVGRTRTGTTSKVDLGLKESDRDPPANVAWRSSQPQKTPFHPGTHPQNNSTASNSSAANAAQRFPVKPAVDSSRGAAPAVPDVPDEEDLSAFFSSDPAWDDPAWDDDLMCEMCDDLENQIRGPEGAAAARLPAEQRAALQPSNRKLPPANRQAPPPQRQTLTPTTRLPSLTTGFVTVTQAKNTSSSTNASRCVRGGGLVQPAPRGNARHDQFTFKKPSNTVSMVTGKVVGQCSAAEIELKKQQAMERRRQRLQAAGNLRTPT